MNKRYLHHMWTRVRPIKPWYFLVLALITGSFCIMALRNNNLYMAKLRDAVYAADKSGQGVQPALQALQVYVTSHMNTQLSTGPNAPYPPIQLQYTYDRAVQAAGAATSAANTQIYTDAQNYCQQTIPNGFSGRYRISCVQSYIQSHGVKAPIIPDSLYKFDFVSPTLSPDFAGWSVVVTVLCACAFLILWVVERWLKLSSK